MSRYGTFTTGTLTSTNLAEQDLRTFFPLTAAPLAAEEDPETYPYIWFSFEEAVALVYRVRRIRVQISLTWTDPPGLDPVTTDEMQWMLPNTGGTGDERSIIQNSFGIGGGLIGRSVENAGSPVSISLGIASYKASDQTFRIFCPFGTDVAHKGVGTFTSTSPGEYVATAATLNIFGHTTPLTYPAVLGTAPTVSGSVIISPQDWREYRDVDGNNPIYDDSTGFELITPVPGGIG